MHSLMKSSYNQIQKLVMVVIITKAVIASLQSR